MKKNDSDYREVDDFRDSNPGYCSYFALDFLDLFEKNVFLERFE
jgi:hypothetical protein